MIEAIDTAPVEPAFSQFYDFPFDPFQIEAMAEIRDGRSVMVAAPTSSGKTVVAEYALWRALRHGARAIYTTPIKALSNQKRRDLEVLFPGQVGLLTGDRSENADAPIVVMTTEVLRNMLVEDTQSLDWVTCVVFDEVHYLADPDRGTVWEEAIIACPRHVQLVCLSATIANAEEIAAWIGQTHRDIALVRHDERPVPLEHYYHGRHGLQLVRDGGGVRRAMFVHEGRQPSPHPADVVRAMQRADLLPAIWFAFSRRAVEEAAEDCAKTAPRPTRQQQEAIERAITWTLDTLPEEDRKLPQLSALMRLLRHGVGFHHAGLLPPLKELVERLFTEGRLSVVCATDTLAIGINMPARTVVISNLARPFGGTLTPNDFSQLTGRAGRRGIDSRGAVVVLPGRSYVFEEAYRQVCGDLQPVESAFRLRYSTLLSALEGSDDRLKNLVQASLRQYQMKTAMRRALLELATRERQLADTGLTEADEELGSYLILQAELNEAEKEQKRSKSARTKNPKSRDVTRRHERAKTNRERLTKALRSHPHHGVAIVAERQDPDRIAALRRVNTLRNTIRQAQAECDQDASRTAEAVRLVLTKLGYMDKRGLTRKARGMREIVAPSGIVLSELYERRALDNLDAAELAEAVSWFASDQKRRRENTYRQTRSLTDLRRRARDTFERIAGLEEAQGIQLAQGPSEWFHSVAYAWCRGDSLEDITKRVEMAEGDVVSILNKTVDLLDQLESMLIRYDDRKLLSVAADARRLLVRGLVAMVRGGDAESVNGPAVAAAQ
ncbi:MAG: DEAD/DEAH box helicase [Chloroflexota bacterium]|nr:DEAD/DEAH box helicase [Chloroflexota bacterium]